MSQNPETTDGIQQPMMVLVADDHGLFRVGVCSELTKYPQQMQIAGGAATVEEAIAVVTKIGPQVALLDVHLPGRHGGGDTKVAAVPENEAIKFLTLSVSDAAEDVAAAIRARAHGHVTKTTSTPDLVDSIIRMVEGDAVFSPRLVGLVLDTLGAVCSETVETDNEPDSLTSRESKIMRLTVHGYVYKEATSELYISAKAAESHVSAVLRKLQLSNRYELLCWAVERRINQVRIQV